MVEILKITGSYCRKYENARHARFHEEMHTMVSGVSSELIHVTAALLKTWKASIDKENDSSRSLAYSYDTALLVEKDRERDNLITYFFGMIANELNSPIAAKKEAATRLNVVVQTYKSIQWETVDMESQLINGMIKDLSMAVNAAAATTLAVDDLIQSITIANKEYIDIQSHRSNEEQANYTGKSKENRAESDNAFQAVTMLIEASFLMAADEAAQKPVRDLILNMNRRIDYFKTNFNQSQGQKAANKKDDPVTPDTNPDTDPVIDPATDPAANPVTEPATDPAG